MPHTHTGNVCTFGLAHATVRSPVVIVIWVEGGVSGIGSAVSAESEEKGWQAREGVQGVRCRPPGGCEEDRLRPRPRKAGPRTHARTSDRPRRQAPRGLRGFLGHASRSFRTLAGGCSLRGVGRQWKRHRARAKREEELD
ncbi:unnamed protein product [Ectocarpus sp. 12 AP-2014]